jgi:predicted TIM-barrel fold metal-dependent hydrolase
LITDCHIHIQPLQMFRSKALELMKKRRPNFERIVEFTRSPKSFLKYLDASGIDRAVLINYVAPDVIGFSSEVNQFIADYVKANPKRLIPCGGIHPRQSQDIAAEIEQILRLKIRMIKIHPPHQLLFPNDYLNGVKELEIIYRAAEANGIPVMFHTGTSIFPGARNRYGDPMSPWIFRNSRSSSPTAAGRYGCRLRSFYSGVIPMSFSILAGFRLSRCSNIFLA